jgi:acyl-CoA synthetase (AMP-forming)/AMP-acid ligase II
MDIRQLLKRGAERHAERTAVVADDQRVSFAEMWGRGVRLANGLASYGLQTQDHVAVLEENSLAAADFYVGAAIGNYCRVPLYPRNKRESHVQMLRNAEAKALVVEEKWLSEVDGIVDDVPTLEHVIVRDSNYPEWLKSQSEAEPNPPVRPSDLVVIRHTGGTSGAPLAAAFSHDKWRNGARDWFYNFPPPVAGDPILHVGSIAHASGYTFLPIWIAGGVQVMTAGLRPDEIVDVLEQERIAYVLLPPTVLNLVCRVPGVRTRDFSALKVMSTGTSPIKLETIELARQTFGDAKLWQLYGGTEAAPTAVMGPSEWFADLHDAEPLLASGRVGPWAEMEVRGEDGTALPLGEVGEIWVRADCAIDGFYNAPEETENRVKDGFISTGDLGRLDRYGYLYLVDRKNEVIVSGGSNIFPTEIENAIASHPDVIEVAVFGVPHDKWGETPMAVCYVRPDAGVTEADVIGVVAQRLGSYKKPTRVEFQHEPLPKTPVGKLLRRVLRDPYWDGHERRIAGA